MLVLFLIIALTVCLLSKLIGFLAKIAVAVLIILIILTLAGII